MKNKKFLFYPLILFFILFLFDKIFLLDRVRSYVKSDFTYIYYETREDLFEMLKKRKSDKKLLIILGSSRLLYFDSKDLEEFYPNWDIYNFSSAVTPAAPAFAAASPRHRRHRRQNAARTRRLPAVADAVDQKE
jgi:hypothetical protein